MKISASKKQLAKIIRENGGWHTEANWAAQDRDVAMYSGGKPYYDIGCSEWASNADNGCCVGVIKDFAKIPNWHQTILSRDEYFNLYPAPDADGWIKWEGGECPVEKGVLVDVRYRNVKENIGVTALLYQEDTGFSSGRESGDYDLAVDWSIDGSNGDIVAYRLHKTEHTEQEYQDGIKPVDPAKQEPTIEQLAADYKVKLAIAQQAQEEADSHRCGAESALERLYQAGLAIGLDIAIADSEQEGENQSELAITDWRDLQVGDVVEVTWSDNPGWVRLKGVESVVTRIGHLEGDVTLCPRNDDTYWVISDNTEWRFIRRP